MMSPRVRPTVRQVFGLSLLGLLLGLALLFYLVLDGTQQTVLQSAERYRELASREVSQHMTDYLQEAPMAVTDFENRLKYHLTDPRDLASLKKGLFSLLLDNGNISEATFTFGQAAGFDEQDHLRTTLGSVGQIAVFRTSEGQFEVMRTWFNAGRYESTTTVLFPDATAVVRAEPVVTVKDPTLHGTFQTPASRDFYGRLIPTDLHWSQLDESLPQQKRRIEVSVLKAIESPAGQFAGVIRIGLLKDQIDKAAQAHIGSGNSADPHLIFLCDHEGRLITGFAHHNRVVESGDDLRIDPGEVPAVIVEALRRTNLDQVSPAHPVATSFRFNSKVYLSTLVELGGNTQQWIVGIVVPRDFYLGHLLEIRKYVLWVSLVLMTGIILLGSAILRSVARAHSMILKETENMNAFRFAPSKRRSFFRDIGEVLSGLERAKTAVRSMSKYVPVDLVRRLYHEGEEPVLGGQVTDLSILFTDIRGFTSVAETFTADNIAKLLGFYLETMSSAIQDQQGTIDKFIGDGVMAFWNAPEAVLDHEILACRAVLECQERLRKLYNSDRWQDAPRLETRFGLHSCSASVGHFGSPDRLSYTAMGDGVNMASRLEGLNKFYGTTAIASETIYCASKERFDFRLLDRVAVRGKSQSVLIYELVGEKSESYHRETNLDEYERAFAFFQQREFQKAVDLLNRSADKGPAGMLLHRCLDFLASPPGKDWSGVHVFDSK